MQYTATPLKRLFFIASLICSFSSNALNSTALQEQANSSINELYHTLNAMPNTSMAERIDWFSSYFKGKPYILGSLGEGSDAPYDQYPLYRIDGFDCDTYVNTVLALALASSLDSFQSCLKYNRYHNGKISYIDRNHFTSIDWNKNNQIRGVLKDITLTIKDQKNHQVAVYAKALINKAGWYAHKNIDTIRLQTENKEEQEKRLAELKAKGKKLKSVTSKIAYIPLTALFSEDGKPNVYLFSQIPNGAVVEIIRPNWDLRKQIGTALNVSHLGFAIWIKNTLYFRQASSQLGGVVDVPLADYLNEARNSPTIKGINIQVVLPQKPVSGECRRFLGN